jgi:hypothetical protein
MDLVYLIHKNNIFLIFSLLKISFINWVDLCFSSGPYPLSAHRCSRVRGHVVRLGK